MNDKFVTAAQKGDVALLASFIKLGITVDAKNISGDTALIWASHEGHLEAVQFLLENGADPNLKDNLGNTALHWAARNGHQKVNALLLRYKADRTIINDNSLTPIEFALAYSQERAHLLENTLKQVSMELDALKTQMLRLIRSASSKAKSSHTDKQHAILNEPKQELTFFQN